MIPNTRYLTAQFFRAQVASRTDLAGDQCCGESSSYGDISSGVDLAAAAGTVLPEAATATRSAAAIAAAETGFACSDGVSGSVGATDDKGSNKEVNEATCSEL